MADYPNAPIAELATLLEPATGRFETASTEAEAVLGRIGVEGASADGQKWMDELNDVLELFQDRIDKLYDAINTTPTRSVKPARSVRTSKDTSDPSITSAVLGHFLGNTNVRLEELRAADNRLVGLTGAAFKTARQTIINQLLAEDVETQWSTTSRARGTRYTLIITEGQPILHQLLLDASAAEETPIAASPPQATEPHSTEVTSLKEPVAEVAPPKEITVPVKIRGQEYHFSPTEYKIIEAILADNHTTRDIIAFLCNGGNPAPDFHDTEFKPAVRRLESLYYDNDGALVQVRFKDVGGGNKRLEFHLPDGARLERYKGVTSLRITDTSSYRPTPPAKPQNETTAQSATVPPKPNNAFVEKTERAANQTAHLHTTHATLQGSALRTQDNEGGETETALTSYQRKIIALLAEGERRTIDQITKLLGAEQSDSTLNNVVAGELGSLQKVLGATTLRRKQKSGQPARWWLEPGALTIIASEESAT